MHDQFYATKRSVGPEAGGEGDEPEGYEDEPEGDGDGNEPEGHMSVLEEEGEIEEVDQIVYVLVLSIFSGRCAYRQIGLLRNYAKLFTTIIWQEDGLYLATNSIY